MKARTLIWAMAVALAAIGGWADDIKAGDTAAQVTAVLGQPIGLIRSETYQLWYYDRGKVELRNGKVSAFELMTAEEAVAARARQAAAAAEQQRWAAEARAQRLVEGAALREAKLADSQFLAAPARDQVAFWQSFRRLYPEVNLPEAYLIALRQMEADALEQRLAAEQERRVAELERRVAEAERRTEQAESRARRAENNYAYYPLYYQPVAYTWPRYYPPPMGPPRPVCPPAKKPPAASALSMTATRYNPGMTITYQTANGPCTKRLASGMYVDTSW